MRTLLAKIFGSRRSKAAGGVSTAGVQPGLWSSMPPTMSPATPATIPAALPANAPVGTGKNPFAAPGEPPGRTPLFMPGPNSAPGSLWSRAVAWVKWPANSGARRRLFPTNDQLELVLGRPKPPARNRNLEIGLPAHVRRSDVAASKSKVIYESKPAATADATRMMEESDRTYSRLRGRRLDSMRVDED